MKYVAIALIILLALALTWATTVGIIWLICICFNGTFDPLIATCFWLVLLPLIGICSK